ncbi:hypothetical protein F5141DRAFT_1065938 [Pisolithus sp. B1]|nr:hypothetical protein F5141DRAFT_1065938 [Pisolithus sp. B1]
MVKWLGWRRNRQLVALLSSENRVPSGHCKAKGSIHPGHGAPLERALVECSAGDGGLIEAEYIPREDCILPGLSGHSASVEILSALEGGSCALANMSTLATESARARQLGMDEGLARYAGAGVRMVFCRWNATLRANVQTASTPDLELALRLGLVFGFPNMQYELAFESLACCASVFALITPPHDGWDPPLSNDLEGIRSSKDNWATSCQFFPKPSRSAIIFNIAHGPLCGRYHIILNDEYYLGVSIGISPTFPLYSLPVVSLARGIVPPPVMLTFRLRSSRPTKDIAPASSWLRRGTPTVDRIASSLSKLNLLRGGLSATKNLMMYTYTWLDTGATTPSVPWKDGPEIRGEPLGWDCSTARRVYL